MKCELKKPEESYDVVITMTNNEALYLKMFLGQTDRKTIKHTMDNGCKITTKEQEIDIFNTVCCLWDTLHGEDL